MADAPAATDSVSPPPSGSTVTADTFVVVMATDPKVTDPTATAIVSAPLVPTTPSVSAPPAVPATDAPPPVSGLPLAARHGQPRPPARPA